MIDLFKKNKYLFIIVGLIVAALVWYGMSDSAPQGALSNDGSAGEKESMVEREIINTLLELKEINLEGQIFNDPAFARLRDFSTEIVLEPVGRENPFAPLEEITTVAGDDASEDRGQ